MKIRKIPVLLLLVLSFGCSGGASLPPLTQVSGTVTYKGEPLQSGTVVLYPENGTSATGEIINGKFEKVTTASRDGAAIGNLKVAVIALEPADANNPMAPRKSLIPEKFNNPETSGESITTVAGKANEVTIDLKN